MSSSNQRIPVSANVLGTIGTICWCVQLVPQIWHNWRHKKTDGLPPSMMLLWGICSVPFGVYMILQNVSIPLQIQPQLFAFFAYISWAQILYYNHKLSRLKASALMVTACLLSGGVEAMFILTLRIPYHKGITWPGLIFGIIAAIMLIAGFLPIYREMWTRKGRVVGFNWLFLCIDSLGALVSLFALAVEGSFDILGGILYILVFVAEAGMFASHMAWRFRHRKLLRSARESGKSVDELLLEQERQRKNSNGEKENSPTVVDANVPAVEGNEGAARRDNPDLEQGPE